MANSIFRVKAALKLFALFLSEIRAKVIWRLNGSWHSLRNFHATKFEKKICSVDGGHMHKKFCSFISILVSILS